MKKAKIILTVIAALAVVGGALAFKAKRTPIPAYFAFGATVTSSTMVAVVYTTTVPFCIIDPDNFIGLGDFQNTWRTALRTITGFSPNGTRTWREVICIPTFTQVSPEE